jgi:hypothetical protein
MKRTTRFTMALVGLALSSLPASANDRWEVLGDGGPDTRNVLRHGVAQSDHDLEGPGVNPDRDWMRLVTKERHSYEARVSGLYWDAGGCGTFPCPLFDRVDAAGAVLTAGGVSSDDVMLNGVSAGRTVRWIASPGGDEWLRVIGDQFSDFGPGQRYAVVYHDTTLFVPRWNNSATQTTVLLLQNATNAAVTGSIYFDDEAGNLLATVPVSVPQHGLQVVATGGIAALVGHSGSAEIAQQGGYGGIVGKAVALEPATGFTFDTAITPLPR